MSVRRRICHAIAKLPPGATPEEVGNSLDLFRSTHDNEQRSDADDDDGVTPLMVACDKKQGACLQYMMELYPNDTLWGRPDDTSAEKCGANTALHHAAMLGCVQAIDSLVIVDGDDDDGDTPSRRLGGLLSKTNIHSDTPIMMACANNQVAFLDVLRERIEDEQVLLQLLLATNDDGETPLSLGFGHGHAQIVQCLLAAGVPATYEMVQECKSKLKQIDALLLQYERVSATDSYEAPDNTDHYQQRTKAKCCLVILEVHLAQKARESMEQLIKKETQQEERKRQAEMKKKRRRAESKKVVPSKPQHQDSDAVSPHKQSEKDTRKVWKKEEAPSTTVHPLTHPRFRTLLDGSLVKSVSDLSRSIPTFVVDEPLEDSTKKEISAKSADELLRERLRAGPVMVPAPVQEDEHSSYDDTDVDAVMDSLCLDASMLLMNSHGMAMHCSPSQLEAIDSILRKQMQSVQEAREIQERLRR
jgi:hypothetical protein